MPKSQQLLKTFVLASVVSLSVSACSWLKVYRIDVPQGTPLTQEQVASVKLGMTPEQVSFYLGSPTIYDSLTPERWDYVYSFKPGTYGERADIGKTLGQQHLSIYFDQQSRVNRIEGAPSIPETQPVVPFSNKSF